MSRKRYTWNHEWKKSLIFSLVAGAMALTNPVLAQQPYGCGSDIHLVEKEYPGTLFNMQQFEQEFLNWIQTIDINQLELSESGTRIVPMVVHVLHEGGNENISKAQIQSQIVAINKDMKAQNSGLTTPAFIAHPTFDTLVANYNLEFRLATKDMFGNCTDGIVRVYTPKTNQAKDFTRFKQESYWDRDKYFNVWVVKTIFNDTQYGTILGYAQFPFAFGGQYPLTSTDGVAVIHNVFGTTGTAAGNTGATLTHEVGHWLGLRHIWGDENCGSDGIDDTPQHKEPNFSGPSCFSIPKTATCYEPGFNDYLRDTIGEMWMNFMDYTADQCLWMFTKGQKALSDFVFNTIAFRGNLITNANNVATGTDDASYAAPCSPAPIADFWSRSGTNELISTKLLCAGGQLTFANGTYNATPTSIDWNFQGGSPSTSTASAPTITYNTPGVYDVTLTATNAQGSNTKTRDDYVRVYPNQADEASFIYYDSFEYGSLYDQGKWLAVNEGNQTNGWENFAAGYLSNRSMRMRNESNVRFETDALISPMYDLTTIDNDQFTFRYAYAVRTNNPFVEQTDRLEVYVSTNCGQNWTRRNITVDNQTASNLSGARLVTAGLDPDGFVPTSPLQWKQASVNITPYVNNNNVRFMFLWTSGGPYGNDFFLDDIMIQNSQAIGIEEATAGQTGFKVFPNPVSSVSQVYFNLTQSGDVQIDLLDITGRVVGNVFNGTLNAGEQTFQIEHSRFQASGIYIVRLIVNGAVSTQKIVVE
ncbi:MAG: M43 family zinc metalloprotease [Flavobacteriales bacterium]|nr:M43 family zinc metalloprotease [Flavobacteriales bacterium]